ncbi:hypothetical protein CC86DRAFT_465677 [Ophiobolus disseminans]|uniref:Apple domain-containing protein n=1 Tax=Ophiobolus disseminans TaxID=1469910 RepID=A0A6A7A3Y8_9PLEO|nr:hypothetical protein CC86DRAFT_465677 [Ophiobolus disseminans]
MADAPQVAYEDAHPEVYQREAGLEHQQAPQNPEVHAYYGKADAYEEHVPVRATPTILGIRRRNFWILAVIAAVIVAATISGSVGGAMAVRDSGSKADQVVQQTPTPTSAQPIPTSSPTGTSAAPASSGSATSSKYVPILASAVPLIDISCPSSSSPPLKSFNGKQYACTENRNIVGNDITGISAYSLQQCIDACSTMNTRDGKKCAAVTIGPDLAHAYEINNGANCWLKEKSSPTISYTVNDVGGTIAILAG